MNLPTQWGKVPASYFSATLGLTGLGAAWRHAHQQWGLPPAVGECLMLLAAVVWAWLLLGFIAKWLFARDAALAEVRDAVQCCFLGLAGVSTMLVALGALPYSRAIALALVLPGAVFTIGFAAWRTGTLWSSERNDSATTAVMYIPSVAGGFVSAIALSSMGWTQWGQMAFGVALLSWLAIESVILRRLYIGPALAIPLRPTMGIQLAPPAVGLLAYLSLTGGVPDFAAHALLGHAVLQVLVMLVRLRWVTRQAFTPSYWGFTFGITALAQAPLVMVAHGGSAPAAALAPLLFVLANVVVAILLVLTVRFMFSPTLTPAPTTVAH